MTDGENNAGKIPPNTAAEAIKALGIHLFAIGAGINGVAPVPVFDPSNGRPVTDVAGNIIYRNQQVQFNEAALKEVAQIAGGQFFRATDTDSLENIYRDIDKMEKSTVSVKKYQQYRDLVSGLSDGGRGTSARRAAAVANHLEKTAVIALERWKCGRGLCAPICERRRTRSGHKGPSHVMSFGQSNLALGLARASGAGVFLRPRRASRDGKAAAVCRRAPACRNWPGRSIAARRIMRFILLLLVLALVIVSLARPRWGYAFDEVKRKGLDLLLAVDVSRSMLSNDVQPNRLERVKLATQDLLNELQGDRVGLIAFAGKAFLQAPLTIDYDAAVDSINELDTKIIPEGGTNISDAIALATRTFGKSATGNRALIIFTDGEELSGDAVQRGESSRGRRSAHLHRRGRDAGWLAYSHRGRKRRHRVRERRPRTGREIEAR